MIISSHSPHFQYGSATNIHVMYRNKYWDVFHAGMKDIPCGTFISKIEAVGYGTTLARTDAVELIVHGMNGRFQYRHDYRDMIPPDDY